MWLGIDFGTCFSSAAFMRNGVPTFVKMGYNTTSLPSSAFVTKQCKLLLGQEAEDSGIDDPSRLRREFKRDLGSSRPYIVGGCSVLPEELVAGVLAKLRDEARVKVPRDSSLTSVVLTVPAVYEIEAHRRELMRAAATRAGFEEVQLLPEPVAAALYYGASDASSEPFADGERLLVYDLGGGTFDAALVEQRGTDFETLTVPVGLDQGGTQFDHLIFQDLLRRCPTVVRRMLDGEGLGDDEAGTLACQRINFWAREECRRLKHKLTTAAQASIYFNQAPLEPYVLTREDFNQMIAPIIEETVNLCRTLLKEEGLKPEALAGVLMVGGSCHIPFVQELVSKRLGRKLLMVDDPALATCAGAAIHGAQLEAKAAASSAATRERRKRPSEFYKVESEDVFGSFGES
jgi:molecular chaperone DnaK (HSP70)